MVPEAPESHQPDETPGKPSRRERLKTRGGKIWAAVLGAIGLAILGFVTAVTTDLLESAKERISAGPAVAVEVVPPGGFLPAHPFAPYYVVPRSEAPGPAALPPASVQSLLAGGSWASNHAVAGSPQVVRLELRAKSDEPVILQGIRVNIVRGDPPVRGWFVAQGGCGPQPVRVAAVDLDSTPPAVAYLDERGRPVDTLALRIGRSEPEILELHASTRQRSVDWTAELVFSGPDGADSAEVDDEGQPFRVTSETASRGYESRLVGAGGLSFVREPNWDDGIEAC